MASTASTTKICVDKTYQNAFMKGIQKLRQNEEYTDVTLQSGDVQIQCHRVVLEAASDYFKTMFKCGLKESTSDIVQLTMEADILTCIVDYIYTSEIELTVDNVESLVKAGDVLQLNCLKNCCEDFMVEQVDMQNCIGFYRFATLYRLDTLQKTAKQLTLAEFKTVAFNAEFKELTCSELMEYIKDDDVSVEYEDVVFDAVLGWVRHDLDNRKSSLEAILEHVRLPYCTSNCLWHMKDVRDLLTPKCYEYLHEALSFQTDTMHHHGISSCRTLSRTNFRMKSCLLVVGGIITGQSNKVEYNHCQYYEEDSSCWKSLAALPIRVGRFYSVCCVDRGLLLTGGVSRGALNQSWLYDLVTKKWEAMPPLTAARYKHRSVSLGDFVYVVGGVGVGDMGVLASVECLDLKRLQWSSMPNMPQAVSNPMVVTYGNKVFVFGGRDTQAVDLCCTQVFDTKRGSWSTQSDSPTVCILGAAVTLNDSIYVVGGFRCTCYKYDPASDSWTSLSQPQHQHGNAPAVVWRGSILIAGGCDDEQKSSVIEEYDPLTDTWSNCTIASLNEKLACHCMFNIDLHCD